MSYSAVTRWPRADISTPYWAKMKISNETDVTRVLLFRISFMWAPPRYEFELGAGDAGYTYWKEFEAPLVANFPQSSKKYECTKTYRWTNGEGSRDEDARRKEESRRYQKFCDSKTEKWRYLSPRYNHLYYQPSEPISSNKKRLSQSSEKYVFLFILSFFSHLPRLLFSPSRFISLHLNEDFFRARDVIRWCSHSTLHSSTFVYMYLYIYIYSNSRMIVRFGCSQVFRT